MTAPEPAPSQAFTSASAHTDDEAALRRRATLRPLSAQPEPQEALAPSSDGDSNETTDEFHRRALQQLIRTVCDQPNGEELMRHAMTDPSVRSLFERYRLIRRSSEVRIREALTALAPRMEAHGGGVRLAGVESTVALLVLDGACNGCSFSRIQLRDQLEQAILAAAPELTGIELLTRTAVAEKNPLTAMGQRAAKTRGWIEGPPVTVFEDTEAHQLKLKGKGHTRTLVVRRHRDRHVVHPSHCPDHSTDLRWRPTTETIACESGCEFTNSGAALHRLGPALEVLPTRVENGRLWVLALDPDRPANPLPNR